MNWLIFVNDQIITVVVYLYRRYTMTIFIFHFLYGESVSKITVVANAL